MRRGCWSADLALPLAQSSRHELVLQMGDPQPGWGGCDERLSAAFHLNPGDEISVALVVELTDGCHISLHLKEQQYLLHPDSPCEAEHRPQVCLPHCTMRTRLLSLSPLSSFLFDYFYNTHCSKSFDTLLFAQITKDWDIHLEMPFTLIHPVPSSVLSPALDMAHSSLHWHQGPPHSIFTLLSPDFGYVTTNTSVSLISRLYIWSTSFGSCVPWISLKPLCVTRSCCLGSTSLTSMTAGGRWNWAHFVLHLLIHSGWDGAAGCLVFI